MEEIDSATAAALRLFDFAERGNLPIAGGAMDQAKSFMEAMDFYRAEMARMSRANGE